jgi:hypothetical protein
MWQSIRASTVLRNPERIVQRRIFFLAIAVVKSQLVSRNHQNAFYDALKLYAQLTAQLNFLKLLKISG